MAERIDNASHFECSACNKLTDASNGGCPDEYDPEGTMCSECWCEAADGVENVDTSRSYKVSKSYKLFGFSLFTVEHTVRYLD